MFFTLFISCSKIFEEGPVGNENDALFLGRLFGYDNPLAVSLRPSDDKGVAGNAVERYVTQVHPSDTNLISPLGRNTF